MLKTVEDFQKLTRNGFEASTQAAAAWSRGFQQIAGEASEFSKKALEDGSTVWSKLIGANDWRNAIQVQTDYAKTSYEGLVAEYAKVGEMVMSVTQDACKPFEAAFGAK